MQVQQLVQVRDLSETELSILREKVEELEIIIKQLEGTASHQSEVPESQKKLHDSVI